MARRFADQSMADYLDGKHCTLCGTLCNPMKCSKCRQVGYCSKACQLEHYAEHRPACKAAHWAARQAEVETGAEAEQEALGEVGVEAEEHGNAEEVEEMD